MVDFVLGGQQKCKKKSHFTEVQTAVFVSNNDEEYIHRQKIISTILYLAVSNSQEQEHNSIEVSI